MDPAANQPYIGEDITMPRNNLSSSIVDLSTRIESNRLSSTRREELIRTEEKRAIRKTNDDEEKPIWARSAQDLAERLRDMLGLTWTQIAEALEAYPVHAVEGAALNTLSRRDAGEAGRLDPLGSLAGYFFKTLQSRRYWWSAAVVRAHLKDLGEQKKADLAAVTATAEGEKTYQRRRQGGGYLDEDELAEEIARIDEAAEASRKAVLERYAGR